MNWRNRSAHGEEVLGLCCRFCPVAFVARHWPGKRHGRRIHVTRGGCPLCQTYVKISRVKDKALAPRLAPARRASHVTTTVSR